MKNTFASLLLFVSFITPAKAATVVNGSFEDLDASYLNTPGWDHMVDATGTAWTKFNSPDWMLSDGPENLYSASHAQHFALGGATGTFAGGVYREGVSQVVSGFTVGETYEVSFSHANGLRYNAQTLLHEGVGTIGGWQILVDSTSLGLFASTNDNSLPTLAWTSDWQSSSGGGKANRSDWPTPRRSLNSRF